MHTVNNSSQLKDYSNCLVCLLFFYRLTFGVFRSIPSEHSDLHYWFDSIHLYTAKKYKYRQRDEFCDERRYIEEFYENIVNHNPEDCVVSKLIVQPTSNF